MIIQKRMHTYHICSFIRFRHNWLSVNHFWFSWRYCWFWL